MNTKILTLSAALLVTGIAGAAETNTVSPALISFTQGVSGSSNLTLSVYPSYAPDLINKDGKKDQFGAGAALTYSFAGEVGQYLFAGFRLDFLGSELWAPSIAGGVKADVQVAGHNFTWIGYTGGIVPISGADELDGTWGVIYGTGLKTDLWTSKSGNLKIGLAAAVERWDTLRRRNFDGPVYHIAPTVTWSW